RGCPAAAFHVERASAGLSGPGDPLHCANRTIQPPREVVPVFQRLPVEAFPTILVEDLVKKLFVGNLPFTVTEDRIREMFQEFGEVQSVTIPTDRETGKSRGFAFVEMTNDDDAEKAIAGVNGRKEGGRAPN